MASMAKRSGDYGSYESAIRGIAWNYTYNASVRIYSSPLSYSPSLLSFRSLIEPPLTLLIIRYTYYNI
jgi:hypothetical protein